MNSLERDESLLIGAGSAIEALARKEEATILLASDSHGADRLLYYILREWGEQSDAFVFCGDGIGDVCNILSASQEDEAIARCLPPVIALVEGNNDADRYPMRNPALGSSDTAASGRHGYAAGKLPYYIELAIPLNQTLTVCDHRFFITHGHRFSLYNGTISMVNEAVSQGAQTVLYGHTHLAMAECASGLLTLNPGSCARPRGGLPPSFLILKVKKSSDTVDYTFYRITGTKSEPFNPEPLYFW